MKIFISHSSANSAFALDVCSLLEKNKHECFIAPRNIRPGYEYASEILQGIDNSQVILLLLSREANDSPHVLREIERAVSRKVPILVYKLDEVTLNSSLEYFLMSHQWINTENNDKAALLKYINNFAESISTNTTADNTKDDTKSDNATAITSEKEFNKAIFFPISIIALITACIVLINGISNIIDKRSDKDNPVNDNAITNDKNSNSDTSSNNDKNTNNESPSDDVTDTADISVGDIVTFGNYNNADIEWFVVNISKDNKATLISRHIISFKGYSAPESGQYNNDGTNDYYGIKDPIADNFELQAYVRGNSSWEASSIRQWLNSDKEIVAYTGKAPEDRVFSDFANGYDTEPGFLHNFSDDERASIIDTNIITNGNVLSSDKTITTTDKVFLLSKDELSWLTDAGFSIYATVTPQAAELEETNYYQNYCVGLNTETARYWLREPVTEGSSVCYLVGNSSSTELITSQAGVPMVGIRPALIVDLTKNTIKVK